MSEGGGATLPLVLLDAPLPGNVFHAIRDFFVTEIGKEELVQDGEEDTKSRAGKGVEDE